MLYFQGMARDPAELERFLVGTPFFGGLAGDALSRLASMLKERELPAGTSVFSEGEQGRSMYIVEEGNLVVCRSGESGRRVKLTRLGRGDFFGETTLIEMQPRSTTVVAETETRLLELGNMDLYRLYKEDVKAYVLVLQNINRELCRRLRSADGRITEVACEHDDEVTQIRPSRPRGG